MRTEIDRQLLVHPNCLMFFCDDTGHEDFQDRNFPVFGIGGCGIMAGAIEPVLKQPWRAMKAAHFGGPDVPLHASELRHPTQSQLDALNRFFREQEFCRYAEWKRARVAPDYHIEIAGHYYSAPSRLIREVVEARITSTTVEIFHRGTRVASHAFSVVRNRHTTIPEHMPSAHRRYAEWTPARLMREAEKSGSPRNMESTGSKLPVGAAMTSAREATAPSPRSSSTASTEPTRKRRSRTARR